MAASKTHHDLGDDMNNKPVAWMEIEEGGFTEYKVWREPVSNKSIPLYTHPHPENLGLAESIIKQQELRIAELEAKIDEMAGEIMSLENRIGTMTGYGHN